MGASVYAWLNTSSRRQTFYGDTPNTNNILDKGNIHVHWLAALQEYTFCWSDSPFKDIIWQLTSWNLTWNRNSTLWNYTQFNMLYRPTDAFGKCQLEIWHYLIHTQNSLKMNTCVKIFNSRSINQAVIHRIKTHNYVKGETNSAKLSFIIHWQQAPRRVSLTKIIVQINN